MENLFQGVGRLSQVVFKRAKGSFIYTTCGRELLDFTSQIGVTNTGHCHPKVVDAAKAQIDKLVMGQVNLGYHGPMLELTEELVNNKNILPSKNLDRIFYATTGAEAVENAIKLAKYCKPGRSGVIVFQGGYHGRTALTMALTSSSVIYKQRMSSNPSNIYTLPFPYELHGYSVESCLEEVRLLFQQQILAEEVACMLIEPVLGEGGYVPVPASYLKGLREICKEHGILLIMDEVQTGFGRTGEYFATKLHPGIEPDILIMAKGLASGFPLSAIAASSDLADQQPPGTMGGTYAGNAVSCAAAIATQQVIQEEGLVQRSREQGAKLKSGLLDIQQRYKDVIRDVRGPGCMIGVEFYNIDEKPKINTLVSQACFRNNMLLLPASVYPTLRFIPPLTVSDDEIEMGLHIFEKSLKEVIEN